MDLSMWEDASPPIHGPAHKDRPMPPPPLSPQKPQLESFLPHKQPSTFCMRGNRLTLKVGMTSDGEGNGPVRRIARGGGRSAVLEGGCVEEDESKEPGDGHGAGMMAVEKTSATDDNDGFRPVFFRRLRIPLSRLASIPSNGGRSDAACACLSNILSMDASESLKAATHSLFPARNSHGLILRLTTVDTRFKHRKQVSEQRHPSCSLVDADNSIWGTRIRCHSVDVG
ncbi:hypothetical protein K443DRAFT_12366 [Laccaria amethystina LaAM-08-1]|uniref:Uncharacterized protein n=1 Tax=Laccaria amethystina LaAM-08-1 TaxID=1095629 RepID=A0A0C9WJ60_9AGAR|nr:hypothetical protein K443DRAFT_12366 [Laccaria amethystina LaAM-08-1]